jgi:hypothetical protein
LVVDKLLDTTEGMKIKKHNEDDIEECKICVMVKITKPFNGVKRNTQRPLKLVHIDIAGHKPPTLFGGYQHTINFVDNYSRFTVVLDEEQYTVQNLVLCFQLFQCNIDVMLGISLV